MLKTEHTGHKGSGRKAGFWGTRKEAKETCSRLRRSRDKAIIREESRRHLGR